MHTTVICIHRKIYTSEIFHDKATLKFLDTLYTESNDLRLPLFSQCKRVIALDLLLYLFIYIDIHIQSFIERHLQIDQRPFTCIG